VGRVRQPPGPAPSASVSNLLGSPASGENSEVGQPPFGTLGFQFIGFPSEWGEEAVQRGFEDLPGFQFIGFPSEWGASLEEEPRSSGTTVSNLLGSPASGELNSVILHHLAQ